jgi:hypothetical protein
LDLVQEAGERNLEDKSNPRADQAAKVARDRDGAGIGERHHDAQGRHILPTLLEDESQDHPVEVRGLPRGSPHHRSIGRRRSRNNSLRGKLLEDPEAEGRSLSRRRLIDLQGEAVIPNSTALGDRDGPGKGGKFRRVDRRVSLGVAAEGVIPARIGNLGRGEAPVPKALRDDVTILDRQGAVGGPQGCPRNEADASSLTMPLRRGLPSQRKLGLGLPLRGSDLPDPKLVVGAVGVGEVGIELPLVPFEFDPGGTIIEAPGGAEKSSEAREAKEAGKDLAAPRRGGLTKARTKPNLREGAEGVLNLVLRIHGFGAAAGPVLNLQSGLPGSGGVEAVGNPSISRNPPVGHLRAKALTELILVPAARCPGRERATGTRKRLDPEQHPAMVGEVPGLGDQGGAHAGNPLRQATPGDIEPIIVAKVLTRLASEGEEGVRDLTETKPLVEENLPETRSR